MGSVRSGLWEGLCQGQGIRGEGQSRGHIGKMKSKSLRRRRCRRAEVRFDIVIECKRGAGSVAYHATIVVACDLMDFAIPGLLLALICELFLVPGLEVMHDFIL